MALFFAPVIDAHVIQPVAHYIASITPEHVFSATTSLAVLPLAVYVKENCTIPASELADLTGKFGKLKILTVMVEPPLYKLTYTGDIYDAKGEHISKDRLINDSGYFDFKGDLFYKDKELIPTTVLCEMVDKGEFYSYAVRRPDASMVRMLVDFVEKGENQKYIDAAIKNLVVGGDLERIQTDGVVYMGITAELKGVLRPYNSFLEKA
jgi:hypothetical protein